jgi:RNA polymerase sigma factor (sigma-70 family)
MDTTLKAMQCRTMGREVEDRTRARSGVDASFYDAAAADFRDYRAGVSGALDRLVHRLTPMLWHVVRAYGLDAATAEDVVQSAWLALVRSGDSVADPQAVVRWLTVTARREAWRQAQQAKRAPVTDTEVIDLREPPELGPEATTIRADAAEVLWRAVSTLSERCQRLLRIVAFSERPDYVAVSEAMSMPMGSIGPTRARCLAKLRERLEASGWRQQ